MGREARIRAAQTTQQSPPRLIFGLTRHQKRVAFQLSYAMAMVDNLKNQEPKGSRLHVKLTSLEEHLGAVLDEYRLQRLHKTDLDKASALFDILDEKLKEMFP